MPRAPDYKAVMERKSSAAPEPANGTPVRGRPPLPPRTEFGRWLRDNGVTVKGASEQMVPIAKRLGMPRRSVPKPKTLLDQVNGRHRASLETVVLVRELTKGEIDAQHWLRKLRSR